MIVWDLDGTLADNEHRTHLLPKKDLDKVESWAEFNKACGEDTVIESTKSLFLVFSAFYGESYQYIVTGRAEHSREETETWLANNGIKYASLIMRADDDHRPAVQYKREVFDTLGVDTNWLVVEDDPLIVAMVHEDFKTSVLFVPSTCAAVVHRVEEPTTTLDEIAALIKK